MPKPVANRADANAAVDLHICGQRHFLATGYELQRAEKCETSRAHRSLTLGLTL